MDNHVVGSHRLVLSVYLVSSPCGIVLRHARQDSRNDTSSANPTADVLCFMHLGPVLYQSANILAHMDCFLPDELIFMVPITKCAGR